MINTDAYSKRVYLALLMIMLQSITGMVLHAFPSANRGYGMYAREESEEKSSRSNRDDE
jgi:hypothetical protein